MVRGQELGSRLEHLQSELKQAALERQEFLREQEFQHQRWGVAPGQREGSRRWGRGRCHGFSRQVPGPGAAAGS